MAELWTPNGMVEVGKAKPDDPASDRRHVKTMFDRDIKNLEAYHESRHTESVPDDVSVVMFSEEFLREMDSKGTRWAVMSDLGFNMKSDAETPQHIPVDLSKGYSTYDKTLVTDENGVEEPVGYKIERGQGTAHIFMQGDKHGEA